MFGIAKTFPGVVTVVLSLVIAPRSAKTEDYHAWMQVAPPALAHAFQNWEIRFEAGEPRHDPGNGIFSWRGRMQQGIGRLVGNASRPVTLAPAADSTGYATASADREHGEQVITRELLDVLRRPDVVKLIDKYGLGADADTLDYTADIEFVRVQRFTAALREPRKNEHIVSIRWRATHNTDTQGGYSGIEAWGLFVREASGLKPISWQTGPRTLMPTSSGFLPSEISTATGSTS
jgi:hypothetical protein